MELVYLLVVVLLFIYIHISSRYSEYGRLIDRIPGPPSLPIFGNLLLAFNISLEEAWLKTRQFCKAYYPIFKVWKIKSASVFICHADDLKTALSCKKNIKKSDSYKFMKYGIGDGIIVSDGILWHHRRKIINQAFTPDLLEFYSKTVVKHAQQFIAELRCRSKNVVLNTPPEFLKLSMRVALEATMGLDLDKIKPEEEDEYRNAFSQFSELILYRVCRPFIKNWMMTFLPVGRRQRKLKKVLDNLANKIIEERISYHENSKRNILKNNVDKADTDGTIEGIATEKQCLLITDILLLAEKKGLIDRSGMVHETSTILLAGFETTGTEMCYILALLAENKKAQDLVRAEILQVLDSDSDDGITVKNVKKMEYLDRCIKESLRLLPAVPHFGRMITDDIEFSNYTVPAGTELHMSIYDLHRDPNFWSKPDQFDPDRFLPENVKSRHRFSYAPFSAGLRNCIGQKLAMMQMKILVAYVVHNFVLEPVDVIANLKFELKITLTLDKIRLKFIRIDRQRDGCE